MKSAQCSALLRGLLVTAAIASSAGAWAQWQWKDAGGRRIFSDTPPPASVPDKDILQRPKGSPAPAAPAAPPSTATPTATQPATPQSPDATAAPTDPKLTDLEKRKQAMDKAEADKRKAEEKAAEEKAAKARKVNCENARKNKNALDSGVRMTTTNAKGETEFLDEAGRAAQLRQVNEQIRENCR